MTVGSALRMSPGFGWMLAFSADFRDGEFSLSAALGDPKEGPVYRNPSPCFPPFTHWHLQGTGTASATTSCLSACTQCVPKAASHPLRPPCPSYSPPVSAQLLPHAPSKTRCSSPSSRGFPDFGVWYRLSMRLFMLASESSPCLLHSCRSRLMQLQLEERGEL